MRSIVVFIWILLAAGVNAHFQLQFPPPRGDFDDDKEPTFCDGYANPAPNRTQFPLSGGYFTMIVAHPQWTSGVLVSTSQNATSFTDFVQVNGYAQAQGEGTFCIPLDFSKSNVTNLQAGQNVTIQIVFNGGDGLLYQCADLMLTNNLNLSTSVACSNSTTKKSSATSNLSGSVMMLSGLAGLMGALAL